MIVLNLFAGIGGNRQSWEGVEVTALELDPHIAELYADKYPHDTVIVGDAHQYLLEHYNEFEFIWSSPPCPSHSRARFWNTKAKRIYPDMMLYQEILFLRNHHKGKWVIENVKPYYTPLIPAIPLGRHLLWSNFNIGSFQFEAEDVLTQPKGSPERNAVLPEIGQYVLNCARDIITKQNEKQTNLFE